MTHGSAPASTGCGPARDGPAPTGLPDTCDAADPAFGPRALRRVVAHLGAGDARAALAHAREALVSGHATALLPDLLHLGGVAAHRLGHDAAAESMWRDAVDADPGHAASWLLLGTALAARGQDEAAAECLGTGLALNPAQAADWDRLGLVLMRLARASQADVALPLCLNPPPGEALRGAGLAVALAEACHARAAAIDAHDPAPRTHLGFALEAQARHAEALDAHREALGLAPDHPHIHINIGNVLASLGEFGQAERHHREALRLAPELAAAHASLGVLLADLHRDAEAAAHLETALVLRPDHPATRLNLGFLRLAQGRHAEGWPLHEARHDPALPHHGIPPPPWAVAPWQGEALAGRSVLVWPEQGFGDQIQFCRYAPLLKAHGAGRVTLVCQRPLYTLFQSLRGIDRLVPADVVDNAFTTGEVDLSDHDVWTFPLTLPLHLKTVVDRVPAPIPYLHAPARTHAAAGPGARRIGLVWRGNPRHHNDADRSLPGLETLAPLWSVPGASFVSLQTGTTAAQGRRPPADQPLAHVDLEDFAATARALAGIDLLICVDTSIAHLAGALGVPCWVLLPAYRTDWRWGRDRDDTPWYPQGMRLFRQAVRGDWAGVVERVRGALEGGMATRV